MAKNRFTCFMEEVSKIQALHKGEIEGNLKDYFFYQSKSGIPLGWENKPLLKEIKQKVIKAAFNHLAK